MPNSVLHDLKKYLGKVSGSQPELRTLEVPQLPLFLRERYSFVSAELFGRQWCLLIEDDSWDLGSPGEYEQQALKLKQQLGTFPVFVFRSVPSNTRDRLVQRGVPFIVPGNQAFLPSALVDLRERFPRPAGRKRATLSPKAQLTVLYHLHRGSLESIPLRDIAEKLHCSAMMLTKVKDELEEAGICSVERIGRAMSLKFPDNKRSCWELASARLATPVRKVRWVRWDTPGYPALLAGISALSRFTLIEEDRLPTYALGPGVLEAWLEQGTLTGSPDADQASARIEVWSYEPKLLGDNEVVDPLSLYLSLRPTPDERVRQALEQLLEEVTW